MSKRSQVGKMKEQRLDHEIPPLYQSDSRVLILGSFPSVKSREGSFFYHHPQNRFWKVLARILDWDLPVSIEEKRMMLIKNRIAVWDVIHSCTITGSSDSSIRDVEPNDLSLILDSAPIQGIYVNGAAAYKLYQKYCQPLTGVEARKIPSTSPANAAFSLDRLVDEWSVIRESLV